MAHGLARFKREAREMGFTIRWRTGSALIPRLHRRAVVSYRLTFDLIFLNMQTSVEGSGEVSEVEKPPRAKRLRDPIQTQAKIIAAAKAEFAKVGLGGARIETIAEKAGVNKRMIYEYFKGKEELFQTVLEEMWTDIRTEEKTLNLDKLPPVEAIRTYMTFTWNYYLKNPEFMSLVNSENLHRARHVKKSRRFNELHRGFVDMLQQVLDRGAASGDFKPGIDASQLHLTIAALGYYYLTNRFTGEVIFGFDFVSKEALQKRLEFNLDTVFSLLRPL